MILIRVTYPLEQALLRTNTRAALQGSSFPARSSPESNDGPEHTYRSAEECYETPGAIHHVLGAQFVIADALDSASISAAVEKMRPQAIINELTAFPKRRTAEAMKAVASVDTDVRSRGNAALLAAASAFGVRRARLACWSLGTLSCG